MNYVVAGAWQDEEWQRAAAARSTADADQERNQEIYLRGPRSHPFGTLAYTVIVNGEPRVYPTKDAALADPEASTVMNQEQQPGFKAAAAQPGLPPAPAAPADDGKPPAPLPSKPAG